MTTETQPARMGDANSRESRMVVIERNEAGTPTVWCDPEIADLVTALNAGGITTVASCSGHGEKWGNIALKDGRELIIAPNYEEARARELSAHGGDGGGGTTAATWRANGEPDPHGAHYDCERAQLTMGGLTDDELANAVFLHGDKKLTPRQLLDGELPGIAYLTAAKDRIRWLSRALEKDHATQQPASGDWQVLSTTQRLHELSELWTGVPINEVRQAHDQWFTIPPNAAHGGGGEVRQFKLRTVEKWTGCPDEIFYLIKDDPDFEVRTLVEVTTPPTSASDAEVEAVVGELEDLAGYSFNAECCNSTFPIGQLRRVCKQAAALLTRSPARVGAPAKPEKVAGVDMTSRNYKAGFNEGLNFQKERFANPPVVGEDALDAARYRLLTNPATESAVEYKGITYTTKEALDADLDAALTQQASP